MRIVLLVGVLALALGALSGCKDSASTPPATQPGAGQQTAGTGGGAGVPPAKSPRIPKGPQ